MVVTRSSTPSSPDSTSERFTEARKNLSDRLADAERHEAAGVSRVRFQPSCDDKIVDKEDKLSREELRQARRDEKLRKYMEATSTTVDLDSSEGNREKVNETEIKVVEARPNSFCHSP